METKIGDDTTPINDVNEGVVIDDNDDADALKEKLIQVSEQNKQLFSRAKKLKDSSLRKESGSSQRLKNLRNQG